MSCKETLQHTSVSFFIYYKHYVVRAISVEFPSLILLYPSYLCVPILLLGTISQHTVAVSEPWQNKPKGRGRKKGRRKRRLFSRRLKRNGKENASFSSSSSSTHGSSSSSSSERRRYVNTPSPLLSFLLLERIEKGRRRRKRGK